MKENDVLSRWLLVVVWVVVATMECSIFGVAGLLAYKSNNSAWIIFAVVGSLLVVGSFVEIVILKAPLSRCGSFLKGDR